MSDTYKQLSKSLQQDLAERGNQIRQLEAENVQLKAELAQTRHDYTQLKEAYDAKVSGVPLGPIVVAQTILNQQREIEKLKAEVNQLNGILRHAGWGQGEIDSAAHAEETIAQLKADLERCRQELGEARQGREERETQP